MIGLRQRAKILGKSFVQTIWRSESKSSLYNRLGFGCDWQSINPMLHVRVHGDNVNNHWDLLSVILQRSNSSSDDFTSLLESSYQVKIANKYCFSMLLMDPAASRSLNCEFPNDLARRVTDLRLIETTIVFHYLLIDFRRWTEMSSVDQWTDTIS